MTEENRARRLAAIATLVALGVTGVAGAGSTRLAVLPAENLTDSADAPRIVAPALAEALRARGWQPVVDEPVERILREERARRGDSVSTRVRERLLTELDADGVLSLTILVWLPGRNPIVGLSARILRADGGESSSLQALSAGEEERAFGIGPVPEIDELALRAVDRLARALPAPGAAAAARADSRRVPRGGGAPAVLRDESVFAGAPLRVCLLPFSNDSRERAAPRVLAEILARRLRASGAFEPVEPVELRAALREERVPSLRLLDPERLRAVGRRLGTPLFLRGAIWSWRDGSPSSAGAVPEVELELELVDAESGRVVWVAHHGRRGDDAVGLFLKGRIGTAATLADRALAEILAASERAEPLRLATRTSEVEP